MKQLKTNLDLNSEEKQLISEIENDQWTPLPADLRNTEISRHQQIATSTLVQLKKSKNVNLRLTESDVASLRSRANEIGIPYQTLMTLVLRQYLNKQFEVKI